jgi:hypothetical protein
MMKTHEMPAEVQTMEGHVLVDGPGGTALTLTPEAAARTGERLIQHATSALNQISEDLPKPQRR